MDRPSAHGRGDGADAHVRALIVASPQPPGGVFPDFLDRVEDELAGPDVEAPGAMPCRPALQRGADIFLPIAHSVLA